MLCELSLESINVFAVVLEGGRGFRSSVSIVLDGLLELLLLCNEMLSLLL